jgi:hypothetical protein
MSRFVSIFQSATRALRLKILRMKTAKCDAVCAKYWHESNRQQWGVTYRIPVLQEAVSKIRTFKPK